MTPRPKRGQQIPPPPADQEWDLRYATRESLALPEVERQLPGTTGTAKEHMRRTPLQRTDVCKPLKGSTVGTRRIGGKDLPQWQYDISGAGRILYCPDPIARIVWVTYAGVGHPKSTTAKNKRKARRG